MDPAAGGRRFENRRSVWLCIKESTRGLIHRITLCAAIPNGTVRGDRYNLSGSKKVCRGVPPPSTIAFFYIYTYQYNIKAPAQIHCVYTLTYLDSITFSSFFLSHFFPSSLYAAQYRRERDVKKKMVSFDIIRFCGGGRGRRGRLTDRCQQFSAAANLKRHRKLGLSVIRHGNENRPLLRVGRLISSPGHDHAVAAAGLVDGGAERPNRSGGGGGGRYQIYCWWVAYNPPSARAFSSSSHSSWRVIERRTSTFSLSTDDAAAVGPAPFWPSAR